MRYIEMKSDINELKNRIQNLSNEEIIKIVENNYSDYTDEVLKIVQSIIEERGGVVRIKEKVEINKRFELSKKDREYSIGGINDRAAFFRAIITFFISSKPTLIIWGRLEKGIANKIKLHKIKCSFLRNIIFREKCYEINNKNITKILKSLCNSKYLSRISWGLKKAKTPLALCFNWDNHVILGPFSSTNTNKIKTLLDRLIEENVIIEYDELIDEEEYD